MRALLLLLGASFAATELQFGRALHQLGGELNFLWQGRTRTLFVCGHVCTRGRGMCTAGAQIFAHPYLCTYLCTYLCAHVYACIYTDLCTGTEQLRQLLDRVESRLRGTQPLHSAFSIQHSAFSMQPCIQHYELNLTRRWHPNVCSRGCI